jgi:transcriptional regulator
MGTREPLDLLPGTLELLILKALTAGVSHGYGIASRLKDVSDDVLQVGESSLYPALQRLLLKGWVTAEWGASENNRRARFYTLTLAGRKQLGVERKDFDRLVVAIHKVLSAV